MQWQAIIKHMLGRAIQGVRQATAKVEAVALTAEQIPDAEPSQRGGFFSGVAALEDYYFPGELTGGVCPRVLGQERDIAWHAAAEACDTERLHLVWSVTEDKVWYLASRSSEFASNPHTWCPFTSLLPGMTNARPAPMCYAYYSDEAAVMMTVTSDSLQVHRGTSAIVRAKTERMMRDLKGAQVVTLDPDVIVKLEPVVWQSIALFEDRVRRMLATIVVMSGLFFAATAFIIWLLAAFSIMQHSRDLNDVQERTRQQTALLMDTVEKSRTSVLRQQMAKFAELNEGLVQVGGWLKFYQIKGGNIRWRALVPPSVTGEKIKELGGKLLTTTDKGVTIGTDNDPAVKR